MPCQVFYSSKTIKRIAPNVNSFRSSTHVTYVHGISLRGKKMIFVFWKGIGLRRKKHSLWNDHNRLPVNIHFLSARVSAYVILNYLFFDFVLILIPIISNCLQAFSSDSPLINVGQRKTCWQLLMFSDCCKNIPTLKWYDRVYEQYVQNKTTVGFIKKNVPKSVWKFNFSSITWLLQS